jgi:hypothetical protein
MTTSMQAFTNSNLTSFQFFVGNPVNQTPKVETCRRCKSYPAQPDWNPCLVFHQSVSGVLRDICSLTKTVWLNTSLIQKLSYSVLQRHFCHLDSPPLVAAKPTISLNSSFCCYYSQNDDTLIQAKDRSPEPTTRRSLPVSDAFSDRRQSSIR